MAPSPISTTPFSGNIVPSPAALSSSRPPSSSSSRRNQAHAPPPSAGHGAPPPQPWARLGSIPGGAGERWDGAGRGRAMGEGEEESERDQRSESSSRLNGSSTSFFSLSSDPSGTLANPTQFHTALTSPTSHRPPSAHSSVSSNPHPLSSPHSQQLSQPSSSLNSMATAEAAFDYDDLLGPRPLPGSNTSGSPPSSTEDDKHRPGASSRLQGLGFTSTPSLGGGSKGEIGGGFEFGDEDEDDEERWLHLHSTAHMAATLPTPPISSPPSHHSSLPHMSTRLPTGGNSGGVGSPLSPHVAPFSPSMASLGRASGSPWATRAGQGEAREREPSWNPSNATFSPSPSYTTLSSRGAHSREPTIPDATSPSFFSPAPGLPRGPDALSPGGAYHAFSSSSSLAGYTPQVPPTEGSVSPFPAPSSLFAPPVSQPMSQSGSRDALYLRKDIPVDKGGYVRSGFSDRGGYAASTGTTGSGAAFIAASAELQATASGAGTAGSVSGAESVHSTDEISTIFVVGFPDDMQEREFQNMFLFAEGFEAATLKVPAATAVQREWEKELGAAVVAASSNGGSDAGHGPGSAFDDAALPLEQPTPASALPPHLNPASAAGSAKDPFGSARESAGSPLSNGNGTGGAATPLSTGGMGAALAARKQIIGFARFRTRQQALDARDALTGKRIDAERGCVLKAEMAKKNLHTRRSGPLVGSAPGSVAASQAAAAVEASVPSTLPTPALGGQDAVAATAASTAAPVHSPTSTIAGGSGPSIPLSALDSNTLAKIANTQMNPAVLAEIARQSMAAAAKNAPAPAAGGGEFTSPSAFDAFHSISPQGPLPLRRDPYAGAEEPYLAGYGRDPAHAPLSPSMSDSSVSPPNPPPQLALYARNLALQQQQQDDPGRGAFAPPPAQQQQQQQQAYGLDPVAAARERQPSFPAMGGAGGPPQPYSAYSSPLPGPTPRQQAMNPLASPPLGAFAPGLGVIPRTQNPADMNAPKNTLYVGGLPAVLPSLTGPFSASHLEDSLRNAFSRCPGFKRLQFRSKSNGPIVFVEFVDTAHATRAMQELYGHTLGGLVKGGIRLSYSKNPLGVRSNGMPAGGSGMMGAPHPLDGGPPLVGAFAAGGPYPSSGPVGFDNAPYDPHRRPPDPIYGETAFPTLSPTMPGMGPSTSLTPQLGGLGRSPSLSSQLTVGPGLGYLPPSGGASASSGSTPSHYAGAFSPFSLDGP
ncbi:hypothetical protein JCM10207_007620 [Rhodosporidiobolus poonsookiae]